MDWWEAFSLLEKVLYILAASSTLILIIQTILAIFGIGEDGVEAPDMGDAGDVDFDVDGMESSGDISDTGDVTDISGIQILTIRGVMSFFSIGGWTAIVCLYNKVNTTLSLLIGLVAGLVTMFLLAKLMQASMKLQSVGNLNLKNAIGKQGKVYLVIPEKGKGQGKVNVLLQDRLCEFDAVTEGEEKIATGSAIVVKGVIPPDTLVVEKLV